METHELKMLRDAEYAFTRGRVDFHFQALRRVLTSEQGSIGLVFSFQ